MAFALAAAASLAGGCLDNGSGPQDQWMNTDAYVGPEVSTAGSDGGDGDAGVVACSDAPSFADPSRLSEDRAPDGGAVHAQYEVAMAGAAAGARYVAWIDRDVDQPDLADLRAVSVPAAADPGPPLDVARPTGCDLLLDPALAVTATGTVVLVATCFTGTEAAPSQTQILVLRSVDGLQSFQAPIPAATCSGDVLQCDYPAVAATAGGAVYLAWSEWDLNAGVVVGERVRAWRFDDDGQTKAAEVAVKSSFGAASVPRLAVDPADDVHLAYAGAFTLGGTSYAAYAKLDKAAGEFGTPEVLGPGGGPRLAATSAGVYVVWNAGGTILQEAHSTGGAFSPALPIAQPSATTEILWPALAAGPDGFVHLFWLAHGEAGWGAYYSVTKNQGASWLDALLISGPFDGDATGAASPQHQIGPVDLVADATDVTLGWGDTASTDAATGVTNVYLARRVCP